MIGLGTQDTLGQANDFDDKFETSFDMLWDESFISWQVIGISSQPAAVMLEPDGSLIKGWAGAFPEAEVLSLAAEHSS